MERKTHLVIDETYHRDEDMYEVMVGTEKECNDFVTEQNTFGYQVLPLTKEELFQHNEEFSPSTEEELFHQIQTDERGES